MKALMTIAAASTLLAMSPAFAQTGETIPVVAAENFYGDLVGQVGGPAVAVTSILSNPDDDPHLFEASPQIARSIAGARLVVYNGVDYDPWMAKLLAASPAAGRAAVVAGPLTHHKSGDNPHLWYDPRTMAAVASAVVAVLDRDDPGGKADHDARLAAFITSLKPLQDKIAEMRRRFAGTPVTATEPVFGYMADALGLKMRNLRFQIAVMNDAEPTPGDIAAFENDLRGHAVKVLFYNTQATEDLTKRLQDLAHQSGVPVVGVSETEPTGKTYQQWMMDQLDALDKAWSGS